VVRIVRVAAVLAHQVFVLGLVLRPKLEKRGAASCPRRDLSSGNEEVSLSKYLVIRSYDMVRLVGNWGCLYTYVAISSKNEASAICSIEEKALFADATMK